MSAQRAGSVVMTTLTTCEWRQLSAGCCR